MGLVYFISYEDETWRNALPYVKIGVSESGLGQRLAQLQTGSPFKLKSFGKIKGGDPYFTESYLHRTFNKHRVGGEWFRLDNELVKYLQDNYNVLNDIDPSKHADESVSTAQLTSKIAELEDQISRNDRCQFWGKKKTDGRIKQLEDMLKYERNENDRLRKRLNAFGIPTPSNHPKSKKQDTPVLNWVSRG